MRTDTRPRVIEAQRMMDGVIITFEDGKCALYSSILLHNIFSQAKEFLDEEMNDQPGA